MKNLLYIFLLSTLSFHSFAATQSIIPLTIIYSGNLDGELEPCGCSDEGNFGGIKRRATMLDELREKTPDLITLSAGGLIASEGPGDILKSEYILKGFSRLNYDAIGVQWRDLSYGAEFIGQSQLPWVASNWKDSDSTVQKITPFKIIVRKINNREIKLAFFTWLDPDESPTQDMQGEHSLVHNNKDALIKALAKAKADDMITVLTSTLPLALMQELMSFKSVDLLFVRSNYEVFSEPKMVSNTLVVQPGSRGMRIARLDLKVSQNNSIKLSKHEVIPMPNSMLDSPRMIDWYTNYNDEVKKAYLIKAELRKKMSSQASEFAGEEACQSCHAAQYKTWLSSKHSEAFDALETVGKSFDPDCIKCHTVGFEQPGGFIDIAMTDHLINVQCENCHGASAKHVSSVGKQKTPNNNWPIEKKCNQCHIQKHSPSFAVEKYWPKIVH